MRLSGYGIDSHKLIYHVERVYSWLKGNNIYPIYIEVGPAGGCNQRCIFCGLDYLGHKPSFINTSCWKKFVKEAVKKGVKSVLFSGEGEPLLHKEIDTLISYTYGVGIDVALASNGVLLSAELANRFLKYLTWLRISLDAGTPQIYSKIHRADKKQFSIVLENIKQAVEIKRKKKLKVTIGVQFLLLKENRRDIEKAVIIARELGVDYFSVKPYSKHPLSINEAGTEVNYARLLSLEKKLVKYSTEDFTVVFRKGAMIRKYIKRPYRRCYGLPFWAYISSKGDIYPCSTFLGLKKYCLGNICDSSFKDIWEGERRKAVMDKLMKMDANKCRELCRLDEINRYLWNLKHPPEHINFI